MDWHRLFGLLLTDFFKGTPFAVELEKDLSLMQQFLDVVVLRRRKGRLTERLPDGLDNLAAHNLITFKSHQEALDDWVLKELTGHYVNYRKQVSPAKSPLLPESHFRLYAISSRFPQKLAEQLRLEPVQAGVYDCRRGTDVVRVVVVRQLPELEHNAPLHLFSASAEKVAYGAAHYRQRSQETSTLLDRVFQEYQHEGITMPYTMEDFRRDYLKEHIKDLSPEERLKDLSPEERLKDLSPEERLKGLSLDEIDEIETCLKRLRESKASSSMKKKDNRRGRKR